MMNWAGSFAYGVGGLDGLGYIGFGGGDCLSGGVAGDKPGQERGGEGAAGSVGGAGLDAMAGEPALGTVGGAKEVVGWIEVASGNDEVEAGIAGGEAGGGFGNGFPVGDGRFGEEGQFGEVWGEPADAGKQVLLEAEKPLWRQEFVSGGGAEDRVEDDLGGRNPGFGQKFADLGDHGFGCEHPNLDAGKGQVFGQAVEGLAEGFRGNRLDAADSLSGLDGERRDGGDSVEAVGGEDFEVGCDAGAGGGIEAGDGKGDVRAVGRGWIGEFFYHEYLWTRKGFGEINPEFSLT